MARTNRPKQFERYLESTGRDISAYVAKSPDVSGVFRIANDRDRIPTLPPPSLLSVELDARADEQEALIARMQVTVSELRRTAARLRGGK